MIGPPAHPIPINDAVATVDKVTQGNAGLNEETASAAEELHSHSETLRQQINGLLRLLNGRDQP